MVKVNLILVPIVFISILIAIILIPFNKRVFPNVSVAGQYVGDRTKDEAINYLEGNIKPPDNINLYVKGIKYEILTSEISLESNFPRSIEGAYNYTNSGNHIKDLLTKI